MRFVYVKLDLEFLTRILIVVQSKSKIKLKPSLNPYTRHSILKGLQPIRAFTYKGENVSLREKTLFFRKVIYSITDDPL